MSAESADGLCYQLTKACPKEPEVIPFKDLEINRTEIQMMKKLGAGQFGEVWAGSYANIPFIVNFDYHIFRRNESDCAIQVPSCTHT